jgi:hypothetical protein
MGVGAARIAIPGPLSIEGRGIWSVAYVRTDLVKDAYLLHHPSGVQLNVRELPAGPALPADDLAHAFAQYTGISWRGAPRTESFPMDGGLRGIVGTFVGAMPRSVVREWLVTNGKRFANAATYATAKRWEEGLLRDCEALMRSIRFEESASHK